MLQTLKFILRSLALLGGMAFLFQTLPAFAQADETLGPGDSIRVTVFENPDLTTETRISARGTAFFPLIGSVPLGGQTPTVAAELIAARLESGKFIRDPQVTLSVIQTRSRQVSVLGQVVKPGRYALEETTTRVTDLLALAGGISPSGDEVVTVVRKSTTGTDKFEVDIPAMVRSGDMSANIEVKSGDTIFVKRAPVFYIYGEVQRAGPYRWESEMSVMNALSLGGGLTVKGTERGIKISRRADDGSLIKIGAQPTDRVMADDIIHISESFF